MPSRFTLVCLTVYTLSVAALAADIPYWSRSKAGKISDLPATILSAADRVSFIADYANQEDGALWVYVVNGTSNPISIPSQDSDIYSKRESPDSTGTWRRCDGHDYSFCGNSYFVGCQIPAGHYYAWKQLLHSEKGEMRPVRFRLFNGQEPGFVSNEGRAMVDSAEFERYRYDAMAIRTGPFEDVAAVALGKVAGGTRSSANSVWPAVKSLAERFREDPRLFQTMAEVVGSLRHAAPAGGGPHDFAYSEALRALALRPTREMVEEKDRRWDFMMEQLNDPSNPWRSQVVSVLCTARQWDKSKVRPVLESVLDSPQDPALREAVFGYAEIGTKAGIFERLSRLKEDARYSRVIRNAAADVIAGAFPNPFIQIELQLDNSAAEHGVSPLKFVRVKNIAPNEISLDCNDLQDLLLITATDEHGNHWPLRGSKPAHAATENGKSSLILQPGQSTEVRGIRWWKLLDPAFQATGASITVTVAAESPGLWSVPARSSGSFISRNRCSNQRFETRVNDSLGLIPAGPHR